MKYQYLVIFLVLAALFWPVDAYVHYHFFNEQFVYFPDNPVELWNRSLVSLTLLVFGVFLGATRARVSNLEQNRKLLGDMLQQKLAKSLTGIIPICLECKMVRVSRTGEQEDIGWEQLDSYISWRTEAHFSHGYCPDCYQEKKQEMEESLGK